MPIDYGLHDYPTSPMPAINCALAFYRKSDPDLKPIEAAHAGWHLLGWLGSQVDIHPRIKKLKAGDALECTASKKQKIDALEAIKESLGESGTNPVKKGLDIGMILQIALQLIQLLLKK